MNLISIVLAVVSTLITLALYIPFINVLYRIKLRDPDPKQHRDVFGKSTKVFNKLRKNKIGIPIGAGLLVVLVTSALFGVGHYVFGYDVKPFWGIVMTFSVFMLIGLVDDVRKTFKLKGRAFELRVREKFIIQLIAAFGISYFLAREGLIQLSIPGFFEITNIYVVTILSGLGITFMLNAFNITDGSDGLAGGILLIALVPVWIIAHITKNVPVEHFSAIWAGAMVAFLYFNVSPARLFMGDAGALAFGATLTVLLLMLNLAYLIPILGLLYVVEAGSSLFQWIYRKITGKKFFDSAPLHYHFENRGWPETKVVFRFWVYQVFISMVSLLLVYLASNPFK